MSTPFYRERPAIGAPAGLLVLHHGRGADESDLLPLADLLDPDRRTHVVAPRAPLTLAGSPGYHWYVVPRVGAPDPGTFRAAYEALAALHNELWERLQVPPERTVLGGFSMGSVMSFALGLGPDRPAPAGILAFSGFIPRVEGWQPDVVERRPRVLIAHGRRDPVIGVEFARDARAQLEDGGIDVDYHEFDGGHTIDPGVLGNAATWLAETVGRSSAQAE